MKAFLFSPAKSGYPPLQGYGCCSARIGKLWVSHQNLGTPSPPQKIGKMWMPPPMNGKISVPPPSKSPRFPSNLLLTAPIINALNCFLCINTDSWLENVVDYNCLQSVECGFLSWMSSGGDRYMQVRNPRLHVNPSANVSITVWWMFKSHVVFVCAVLQGQDTFIDQAFCSASVAQQPSITSTSYTQNFTKNMKITNIYIS